VGKLKLTVTDNQEFVASPEPLETRDFQVTGCQLVGMCRRERTSVYLVWVFELRLYGGKERMRRSRRRQQESENGERSGLQV